MMHLMQENSHANNSLELKSSLDSEPPLVVDLDGTLIFTDMLHESTLKAFRDTPWILFLLPAWLLNGRAFLKEKLARRSSISPDVLPYNQELLTWLQSQKEKGRQLVLCTASDQRIANAIADHLNLFDDVIASDGTVNLSGENKARVLAERYQENGFDYVGNSNKDLPVWAKARQAIVVNASAETRQKANASANVISEFPSPTKTWRTWVHTIRAHQWLKNFLLFVPLLAAHQWQSLTSWWQLITAFVAFSLCASAVYITNDLFDLESDRRHPRKKRRPFAAGSVPAWKGVIAVPLLIGVSVIIATSVSMEFLGWLSVYFLLTCSYSFVLKRIALIDCIALAMLYTLRVIAGAAAANTEVTFWLLTESVFLFLSLAFLKRYAELRLQSDSGKSHAHGRGYSTADTSLVQTLGISSGMIATLVLALYLNSNAVLELYNHIMLVWAAIPFLLFWISWMWLQACRGNMHDDPLVFAVKDGVSLLTGAGFVLVLVLAVVIP
jgi:4-hydroxybenzoate polyprenyltransferase